MPPATLPILTLNGQTKVLSNPWFLSAQLLNWNGKENKGRKGHIWGDEDKSCNKIDPHVKIPKKNSISLWFHHWVSWPISLCYLFGQTGVSSSIVGTCYCLSCSAVLKSKHEDQCALRKLEKCASCGEHPASMPCWVNWRHKLSPEKHSAGCSWC